MVSDARERPQRVLAKEHTMNVSANLVNSLASMLTEEQFREFKRNVAIENCPGMTFASEWVASEDSNEFIKQVAEESDDLGYVTSLDIAGIIENGFGNLFFSKYLDQAETFAGSMAPRSLLPSLQRDALTTNARNSAGRTSTQAGTRLASWIA